MLLLVWCWCDLLGVYVGLGLGVLIVLLWMVLLWFEVFLDVLRLGSGCCDRAGVCVVGLGVWITWFWVSKVVVVCGWFV